MTAPASGKTLPIGTPFKLTATATDADNDVLTYLWEELDLGPTGTPTATQVAGQTPPLFRSFVPTTNPTRYFPRLTNLVNNTTVLGERLPTVTRTLKFRCTVRDNHVSPIGVIGGVDYSALVNLNVNSASGPFLVTAPNTALSWTGGTSQIVTWDVANTTAAPVSCALVNIRLSLDGGLTYPVTLASSVANTGTATVSVPNLTTALARVMVEAADNYFFDISDTNFTIAPGTTGPTIVELHAHQRAGGHYGGHHRHRFHGGYGGKHQRHARSVHCGVGHIYFGHGGSGYYQRPYHYHYPQRHGHFGPAILVGVPPTITSFTPTSGPTGTTTGSVGTTVTITGTNFTGATRVTFNGTNAPIYFVNSATQITVLVPAGATTGPITVTTPLGIATSTTNFTVPMVPVITSFTPTSGMLGTVVTITGANFTGATQVYFNGTLATDVHGKFG